MATTGELGLVLAARGAAVVQFSYGHNAVGVSRRDPGTVRPVVAAGS